MDEDSKLLNSMQIFIGVAYSTLAPIICIGNGLTMATIATNKKLHSMTMGMVFNLALADFLSGIILCTYDGFTNLWRSGYLVTLRLWCQLSNHMGIVFLGQSIITNLFLSVERYFAICHPFQYPLWVTKKRVIIALICGWIFTLSIVMPPFFVSNYQWDENIGECRAKSVYSRQFSLFIVICIFFIILSNVVMQVLVWHQMRKIHGRTQASVAGANDPALQNRKQEVKKGKLTAMLFICFVACWAPYMVISPLNVRSTNAVMECIRDFSFWVGVSNALLNFVIYTTNNKELRRSLFRLIKLKTKSDEANETQFSAHHK